ncbi:MAG: TraV family lipoprotein [Proteobacteria bacterium]|nr:TraV family lipoprotein [Pseudomonadota bacterium]
MSAPLSVGMARAAAATLLLPLAGCMNMSGLSGSSKYACAAPEGVACDSVSGTYTNALHNNLPSQQASGSRSESREGAPEPTASPVRQPVAGTPRSIADGGADGVPALALRSQSRVLRLWTKPWEDADGDLWDQGYVYVQVDAGRWQIDHVRQRIRDQYAPLRPPPTPAPAASPAGTPLPADTEAASPAGGPVQRPTPSNNFPSLAQPPAGLGSRPQ